MGISQMEPPLLARCADYCYAPTQLITFLQYIAGKPNFIARLRGEGKGEGIGIFYLTAKD